MHEYIRWLEQQKKSPNTIKRYLTVADRFKKYQDSGQDSISEMLTSEQLETYLLKEKIENAYSDSTVRNIVESIKAYFSFLNEKGIIASNPASTLRVDYRCDDKKPRWLNQAEINKLLSYLDAQDHMTWRHARNRAIVFVFLYAGLRVSEIVDLEPSNILLQDGILYVKSKISRSIPMDAALATALKEWIDRRGYQPNTPNLFVSQRGGALTPDGITHLFMQLRKATDIPILSPSVLRHTYARRLVEQGISVESLARLLGHANTNYAYLYFNNPLVC